MGSRCRSVDERALHALLTSYLTVIAEAEELELEEDRLASNVAEVLIARDPLGLGDRKRLGDAFAFSVGFNLALKLAGSVIDSPLSADRERMGSIIAAARRSIAEEG